MVIKLKEFKNELGTRDKGIELREMILKDKNTTTLDFDGVKLVSNGFCDEVFGKIVTTYGIKFLRKKPVVCNFNLNKVALGSLCLVLYIFYKRGST